MLYNYRFLGSLPSLIPQLYTNDLSNKEERYKTKKKEKIKCNKIIKNAGKKKKMFGNFFWGNFKK